MLPDMHLKRNQYDFIFLGMGLASLSLVMRMLRSGKFSDKKILLIDRAPKNKNDRTWCFWEKAPGFFEHIVHRRWPHISFLSDEFSSNLDISPYEYKMIRGHDLYSYCLQELQQHEQFELVYADINDWNWDGKLAILQLNGESIQLGAPYLFNSIYIPSREQKPLTLLQHFKGWLIETDQPEFDRSKAIMMDFRVHQDHGTSFAYVLPFSETQALVEYTLFTRELLKPGKYDEELKEYISHFAGIKNYRVIEEEFGVIPMTSEKFKFRDKAFNIGTAGGQTKGSSGYTFQFIQKNSEVIFQKLLKKENLETMPATGKRFQFYDNVLLYILYNDKLPGKHIFSQLFKRNKAQQVLKFLDNETTLGEELKIISTLPTLPFLKAAVKVVSGK